MRERSAGISRKVVMAGLIFRSNCRTTQSRCLFAHRGEKGWEKRMALPAETVVGPRPFANGPKIAHAARVGTLPKKGMTEYNPGRQCPKCDKPMNGYHKEGGVCCRCQRVS